MCNKRNTVRIKIHGKMIRIDACMKNIILCLNAWGILTYGCCCGHGKYPMSIVVHDWRVSIESYVREIFSNTEIPRYIQHYKKDREGFYYIPEVVENDK